MAWSDQSSTQLTLDGDYAIVQRSAADWEISLNPGELVTVSFDFDYTIVTSDDDGDLDIVIEKSPDGGTTWETESKGQRIIMDSVDDPDVEEHAIAGCRTVRIKARLRDPDDTVWSGSDTATLDVVVGFDGVSI